MKTTTPYGPNARIARKVIAELALIGATPSEQQVQEWHHQAAKEAEHRTQGSKMAFEMLTAIRECGIPGAWCYEHDQERPKMSRDANYANNFLLKPGGAKFITCRDVVFLAACPRGLTKTELRAWEQEVLKRTLSISQQGVRKTGRRKAPVKKAVLQSKAEVCKLRPILHPITGEEMKLMTNGKEAVVVSSDGQQVGKCQFNWH